jgi:hypothetical protein
LLPVRAAKRWCRARCRRSARSARCWNSAIGVTRNFGLGNALVSADALDALSPSALWRAAADPSQRPSLAALQPEPIAVAGSREQVHLRFITGAGLTPQHLPSFLESASKRPTPAAAPSSRQR